MQEVTIDDVLVRDIRLAADRLTVRDLRVAVIQDASGGWTAALVVAVGERRDDPAAAVVALAEHVQGMLKSNIDHDQTLLARLPASKS